MTKPLPTPSADSQPYWDAAAQGRLAYQHCGDCDRGQYYPRALCSHCGSRALSWKDSAGRGTIHAITQVHIGLPSFKEEAPYAIVLVDLDEGFRMLTNLVGETASDAAIGDRVKAVFEQRDGISLPQFQTDTAA